MTDDPSRRRVLRNTGVLTGAALLSGIPGGPAAAAQAAPPAGGTPLVVEPPAGRLRGSVEGGLAMFKGVPYAAPPVGALRWRPAQPHPGWQGTRDATAFGPSAPQLYREGGDAVLGTHGAPRSARTASPSTSGRPAPTTPNGPSWSGSTEAASSPDPAPCPTTPAKPSRGTATWSS